MNFGYFLWNNYVYQWSTILFYRQSSSTSSTYSIFFNIEDMPEFSLWTQHYTISYILFSEQFCLFFWKCMTVFFLLTQHCTSLIIIYIQSSSNSLVHSMFSWVKMSFLKICDRILFTNPSLYYLLCSIFSMVLRVYLRNIDRNHQFYQPSTTLF